MTDTQTIPAAEIERRLRERLSHWRFEAGALRRVFRVNGFRSALIVTTTVGHVAEAAWHHPEITLSWGRVEVALWSHDAGGVTERDMALAELIEAVVAWRPTPGGALEGTPADAAHAYVLPD